MLEISLQDIKRRLQRDNPWWSAARITGLRWHDLPRRDYFATFQMVATNLTVNRSTILLGPRRVGKTVMLHHFVYGLIKSGLSATKILYVSIDTPVYQGILLEKFVELFMDINKIEEGEQCYVIFDEIQYLKNWESHLKDLTDSYPNVRFIASGSAAAALRLKSQESGAGRFSDFMLPPLTFLEFTKFMGKYEDCVERRGELEFFPKDIEKLNKCFIDYINFGGFPEVAIDENIRANIDSFIKADIIDKVLLKDLPSLYGIQNIQDLNNIFKLLAYNNGQEIGLEAIAQQSQVDKTTIRKFIEYLVNAFLISKHEKMPTSGKALLRVRTFKVFLTNPSMRAALFSPVEEGEASTLGHLAEAAILSQWDHLGRDPRFYYRDTRGNEVDIVQLARGFSPTNPIEVKWSDGFLKNPKSSLRGLFWFMEKYSLSNAFVTSKTAARVIQEGGKTISVLPTSLYCLSLGSLTSGAAMDRLAAMCSVAPEDDETIYDDAEV